MNAAQVESGPKIEDEIHALLDGDLKEAAFGFVRHLNERNLAPRRWFGPNYWRVPHEDRYLCGIVINRGRWRVWFFSGDYSGDYGEAFTQIVHGAVRPCVSCTGDDCPKGMRITVFGKEFENACFQFPVQFENPDGDTLKCVQELIGYWKTAAPRSDSWHSH